MTPYLNHVVKAKMCETTPFVNTVGAHYVASRAHIEQACDSLRHQGQSMETKIGLSKGDIYIYGYALVKMRRFWPFRRGTIGFSIAPRFKVVNLLGFRLRSLSKVYHKEPE